jgi:hypothetical protein
MFRGSVKGTGHPLHSPVSPSLPFPCVTVCHHISTGLYQFEYTTNICLPASANTYWLLLTREHITPIMIINVQAKGVIKTSWWTCLKTGTVQIKDWSYMKGWLRVSENLLRRGIAIEGIWKAGSEQKNVDVHEELVGWQTQTEGTTVKLTYKGNARDRNIFRCREVPFHTWTLDPTVCQIFHYRHISAMIRFRLKQV